MFNGHNHPDENPNSICRHFHGYSILVNGPTKGVKEYTKGQTQDRNGYGFLIYSDQDSCVVRRSDRRYASEAEAMDEAKRQILAAI